MSHPHDIDNQEPLFQFDAYEGSSEVAALERSTTSSHASAPRSVSEDLLQDLISSSLSQGNIYLHQQQDDVPDITTDMSGVDRKGKKASKPLPIRPPHSSEDSDMHDSFEWPQSSGSSIPSGSLTSDGPSLSLSPSSLYFMSLQTPVDDAPLGLDHCDRQIDVINSPSSNEGIEVLEESLTGKGKARELPPVLPPLRLPPSEFGYSNVDWPSPGLLTPTPGPSSYGSAYEPAAVSDPEPNETVNAQPIEAHHAPERPREPIIRRMPSRRRSLSNLSVYSTRSFAARSMSRVRVKMSNNAASNLARKLFSKKRDGASSVSSTPRISSAADDLDIPEAGIGGCFSPWLSSKGVSCVPQSFPEDLVRDLSNDQVLYRPDLVNLKGKGRSYSSPLPASVMDYIPVAEATVFVPVPVIVRNWFDEVLPREIRLWIFASFVSLYELEHERSVMDSEWTVQKASQSRNRWVGRDRGIRELIKLSGVSKAWQSLVYDGQLWIDLNLHPFPRMPSSLLSRILSSAGKFTTCMDISGHTRLPASALLELTDHLCADRGVAVSCIYATQLTTVNLQGCSLLTTQALHYLLIRSPLLENLCLKGLIAVTNTTCEILSVYCNNITTLNVSRCPNVDGDGIHTLANAALIRGKTLSLKELRMSGLTRVYDDVMMVLGEAAPNLEVLDLSYIHSLHNSAIEAFISCEEDRPGVESILLTSRQAGHDPRDSTRYRRRISRLRHLSLSSCPLLTDIACSNLAYAVPRLEILELAGIGSDLKDTGLVQLLGTTASIRKLDLEDATDITDAVVSAITPPPTQDNANEAQDPGHVLEHLTISHAGNISDEALLALIRSCKRLRVLAADNTQMSGLVLKEFVTTMRARGATNSEVVAVDCRGISETLVKDLAPYTRPRSGWRSFKAKKLGYLDGRDREDIAVGQDECDESRVILKSFFSWQVVDAVKAAREKKRKAVTRRVANESCDSFSGVEDTQSSASRYRWWTPGARRALGNHSPTVFDGDRDSCTIM